MAGEEDQSVEAFQERVPEGDAAAQFAGLAEEEAAGGGVLDRDFPGRFRESLKFRGFRGEIGRAGQAAEVVEQGLGPAQDDIEGVAVGVEDEGLDRKSVV